MKKQFYALIFSSSLSIIFFACSSSNQPVETPNIDDQIPRAEMTSIEIIEDTIFYIHGQDLYKTSLEGDIELFEERTSPAVLFGFGSYVISRNKTYTSDGVSTDNTYTGGNYSA